MKKYDQDLHPRVLAQMLSAGNPLRRVAAKIGIDTRTLYKWFKRYPEFAAARETPTNVTQVEVGQIGNTPSQPQLVTHTDKVVLKND